MNVLISQVVFFDYKEEALLKFLAQKPIIECGGTICFESKVLVSYGCSAGTPVSNKELNKSRVKHSLFIIV